MTGKKLRKIMQLLLLMLCMLEKEKIYPAYVSKHNSNHEKKLFFSWFQMEHDGIILP